MRNANGQFEPGPDADRNVEGARKSGRSKALAILDKICAEVVTLELIEKTLRERLKAEPLSFYREFVVALAPKTVANEPGDIGEQPKQTPAEMVREMVKLTCGAKKKSGKKSK